MFDNLRMKCNVVLKAAHGQPAAFDIDHVNKFAGNSLLFICSTGQMSGHITIFFIFLKEVSYAHQASIYLIKNTDKISNIVKYYNLK